MSEIVVFGNSHWAGLAHFYLTHDSPHQVVAFTVDAAYLKGPRHVDLPVVPFESVEKFYPPDEFEMFLPVSYKKMNHLRAERYAQAKTKGYALASYVSSKCTRWPDFQCGDNCFILENNIIQPFVKIGNDVTIGGGNTIGHHTVIQDHVTITSQVAICGSCVVEPFCFFGVHSSVRDEIVIARDTLVGAGVLILRNTKKYEVYKSNLARPTPFSSDKMGILPHKLTAGPSRL